MARVSPTPRPRIAHLPATTIMADVSLARFHCSVLKCGTVVLRAAESRHAARARRLKRGDKVSLFDGSGTVGRGVITGIAGRSVEVGVLEVWQVPFDSRIRLTLGTSCPKLPRQPFLVEKTTELGVWALQPLICHRSVAKPSAATVARWRRVATESAKQCGSAWIPRIEDGQPVATMAEQIARFDRALIAVPADSAAHAAVPPVATALPPLNPPSTLLALIGPEGGWTDDEIVCLTGCGAVPVSLGPRILRVETACIAVATAVALHVAGADPQDPGDAPAT